MIAFEMTNEAVPIPEKSSELVKMLDYVS